MGEDTPFLPRGRIPGRGTAAHIRDRDPAATPAAPASQILRSCSCVWRERWRGVDQILKNQEQSSARGHALDRLATKVSAVVRGIVPHEGGRGEDRSAATLVRPRPQRHRIRSRPTKRRGRKKNRSKRKEKKNQKKRKRHTTDECGRGIARGEDGRGEGRGLCGARADAGEAGRRPPRR